MAVAGSGPPGAGARVHSRYADGTVVLEGRQPTRIRGPDPFALGCPHSVIRWDGDNGRLYQLREFDAQGTPVRDVDFTNPTYPNGTQRPGHPGPPHQHRWVAVNPANPAHGFRRGVAEPFP
jgi:hypothetical protein